jgi:hypothetical protein
MLKIVLWGGKGGSAHVEDDALLIATTGLPPLLPQKIKIFSQFLTNDGLAGGTQNLGVDGSVTSVDYWIPASEDTNRYITKLNFLVGYGASGKPYIFADSAGGALTNGVKLFYQDSSGVETVIANFLANSDFMRYAQSDGLVPTSWEIRHLGANNDYGFMPTINLIEMVPPYGIQLARGTKQTLSITIRDDCTDADDFNCRAFGVERFE